MVADNASENATWKICQKFAAMDGRVRIFRNFSNIGSVRNWKRCVDEAKGEFGKILFSDDCLESNCLSEMMSKLSYPNVALVFSAARIGKSRDESTIAYFQTNSLRVNSRQFFRSCFIRQGATAS